MNTIWNWWTITHPLSWANLEGKESQMTQTASEVIKNTTESRMRVDELVAQTTWTWWNLNIQA